jgi:5-methyltetrahydrofolate--homocysteine methyltransferase
VEVDLASRYDGPLVYGKDAFAGLDAMEWITQNGTKPVAPDRFLPKIETDPVATRSAPDRAPSVSDNEPVPTPPFLGARVAKGIELDEVAAYLNTTALLRNQWQYRPLDGESNADFTARLMPEVRKGIASARASDLLHPHVVYGYFPANAQGNDLVIWDDVERSNEVARLA